MNVAISAMGLNFSDMEAQSRSLNTHHHQNLKTYILGQCKQSLQPLTDNKETCQQSCDRAEEPLFVSEYKFREYDFSISFSIKCCSIMHKILIVRNIFQVAFLVLFCLLWEN
jgi:hypothetical protein